MRMPQGGVWGRTCRARERTAGAGLTHASRPKDGEHACVGVRPTPRACTANGCAAWLEPQSHRRPRARRSKIRWDSPIIMRWTLMAPCSGSAWCHPWHGVRGGVEGQGRPTHAAGLLRGWQRCCVADLLTKPFTAFACPTVANDLGNCVVFNEGEPLGRYRMLCATDVVHAGQHRGSSSAGHLVPNQQTANDLPAEQGCQGPCACPYVTIGMRLALPSPSTQRGERHNAYLGACPRMPMRAATCRPTMPAVARAEHGAD